LTSFNGYHYLDVGHQGLMFNLSLSLSLLLTLISTLILLLLLLLLVASCLHVAIIIELNDNVNVVRVRHS
jgi:hypothetical protein